MQRDSAAVDASVLGNPWRPEAVGLSIEAQLLLNPAFALGNYAQYLKTLGNGVLRVGGNSSDQLFWTASGETRPAGYLATLTPAGIDRLATLAQASGWHVILGINFKAGDATRAADEVAYAKTVLGDRLAAIEIGNEVDYYFTDVTAYAARAAAYRDAIAKRAPGVRFTGTDMGANPKLEPAFVRVFGAQNILSLTRHHYPATVCNGKTSSIATLLSPATFARDRSVASGLASRGKQFVLPTLESEVGSFSCQGQDGVSNTTAGALWTVSAALASQLGGAGGTDFHGTDLPVGPKPTYMFYSPLNAPDAAAYGVGNVVATPVYYGMLLARQVIDGTFVSTTNTNADHVQLYAVQSADSRTLDLVLINVDDPQTTGPTQLSIQLKGFLPKHAATLELASSGAGGLAAPSDQIGGGVVSKDGTLSGVTDTSPPVTSSSLTVTINPGTAQVLTLTS